MTRLTYSNPNREIISPPLLGLRRGRPACFDTPLRPSSTQFVHEQSCIGHEKWNCRIKIPGLDIGNQMRADKIKKQ